MLFKFNRFYLRATDFTRPVFSNPWSQTFSLPIPLIARKGYEMKQIENQIQ